MNLEQIQEYLKGKNIKESLEFLAGLYPGQVFFSSSLSQEDQMLTDIIFRNQIDITVFTIDTGRLFNEACELIQVTEAKYEKRVQVYFPEALDVEALVSENGINCFYESVELRKKCCHVRKVVPLRRALKGAKVWITGLRSGQSESRNNAPVLSWDSAYAVIKYNPLADTSLEEVLKYINQYNVPYNPLHDKGFPSIGCAPCTRAVMPGEDIRAGRWWWEASKKECGLHAPIDFQI
jgi:phosphoadenosine phosphosulfate reductase